MVYNVKLKFDASSSAFSVISVEPDGSFVGEIAVGGCGHIVEAASHALNEIVESIDIVSVVGED